MGLTFEDIKNNRHVQRVIDAWLIEGPAPLHHRATKMMLFEKWPALAVALEQLVREYQEPTFVYALKFHLSFSRGPITRHNWVDGDKFVYDSLDDVDRVIGLLRRNERQVKGLSIENIRIEITTRGPHKEGRAWNTKRSR